MVVHFRCLGDTLRCIASLRGTAPDVPVVIVDNGSDDASLPRLREAFATADAVDVVAVDHNGGFGAGCNRGIARALSLWPELSHVLLINPDAVVQPGCVDALLATAQRRPDAGIVGGRVRSADGRTVEYENGRLHWTLSRSHVPAPSGRTEFATDFVTGALMLIDAALLREGLSFDERYFLYVEDLDLCSQVRARGRTLWVNTAAEVWHRGGGTQRDHEPLLLGMRAEQLAHMTRGKVYFARKWLPLVPRLGFLLVASIAKPLVGAILARHVRFLPTYYRALWKGLRERRG